MAKSTTGLQSEQAFSRRSVLHIAAGAAAVATASVALSTRRASARPDVTLPRNGGAAGSYGVALIRSWFTGELLGTILPDPSWGTYLSQVGNYAFYYPSDWQITESTDPTPLDFSDGFITTTSVVSPDQGATFLVYDVSFLSGEITSRDFASDTIQRLAGDAEVEMMADDYLEIERGINAANTAARIDDTIVTMQTFGSTLPDVVNGGVESSFSSYIEIADADRFDELAETVFLPMIYNFQRFSGGGGEETPTPTPSGGL